MPEHQIKKELRGVGVWEHFTVRDGLPDMKIESLFVDSRGMLWIGTHDRGVARFDGDRFEVFTRRDGLAGDGVFSIIEDREGALWFGSTGGLTRYRDGEFESVVPRSGEQCRFLWGRCADHEGVLWFGLESLPGSPPTVCRWDGKNLDLLPLTDTVGSPKSEFIHHVVADTRGGLWCGGYDSDRLYYYDRATFHCITAPSGPFKFITALLPRPNRSLWIASERGLYVYTDGRFESLGEELAGTGHLVHNLLEDPSGAVWLTTSDGWLLRYEDGAFRLIQKLDVVFWRGLCLDQMGRLWMGAYGMGLYCYDTTRFEVFQDVQGLPSNQVNCLTKDAEGVLWVGTHSGLAGYDGSRFHTLDLEVKTSLMNRYVEALLRDRHGHLWIGTRYGNLYRYDGKVLLLVLETPEIEGYRMLGSLAEDKAGRIWFGFRVGGRSFGYYENGQVHRFLADCDIAYPSYVGGLLVDRQGAVWIGSWDPAGWEGLCRYDGERFTHFTQADGLIGGAILALYEDRDGCIWIGTSAGVCRFDGDDFTTFTQADGLPHEIVTAIAQTEDSTFWFGTEGGGVCRYDGQVFQAITVPGDPMLNVIHTISVDHSECQ